MSVRPFRALTWNINSVRLRLPLLLQLLQQEQPDLVFLQETKTEDTFFPLNACKAAGYPHIAIRGEKSYNGVAMLSKRPFVRTFIEDMAGRRDARHIAAELDNGITAHCCYIPAGGDIPDPDENPKYKHKLESVEWLTEYFSDHTRSERAILAGDLNIAPLEQDVWSHKQLLKVVSHTPAETERMHAAIQAGNWTDIGRHFVDDAHKLYSWWSYRNRNWRHSNRGRRLDHIWCGAELTPSLQSYAHIHHIRDAERTSDHIPVTASFLL